MGTYALEGHRRGHPARWRYHAELFVSTDRPARGLGGEIEETCRPAGSGAPTDPLSQVVATVTGLEGEAAEVPGAGARVLRSGPFL